MLLYLSSILTSSSESYIINLKTNVDSIFETADLIQQILQEIDTQNRVKGIILNFRIPSGFDIEVLLDGVGHLITNPDYSCAILWSTTIDNKVKNDAEITAIISI